MSVDLVASNTHGNLDEQIAQLMQCKSLSKPEDEQYPSKGLYQNWGLNFIIDWNSHDLKGLDRDERLMELGSRNFFLCPTSGGGGSSRSGSSGSVECGVATSSTSCSKQAEKATKIGLPWLKFF